MSKENDCSQLCHEHLGFSERNRDEEVLRILEADINSEEDEARLW
jgi:hypothetical protein